MKGLSSIASRLFTKMFPCLLIGKIRDTCRRLPYNLTHLSSDITCFFFIICREHTNYVNCVRFSPDGSKFITVGSDKKGMVYEGKTGEKLGELSAQDAHQGSIYAVSWSPDSKKVSTIIMLT